MSRLARCRELVPALLLVLASACTSTRGISGTSPNLLTYEEMEGTGAVNLYDAIERLRPRWLQLRSARSIGLPHEIVVYQGPTFVGPVEVLRTYTLESVTHLEYLDGATAAATLGGYGSRHLDGAIILRWRSRDGCSPPGRFLFSDPVPLGPRAGPGHPTPSPAFQARDSDGPRSQSRSEVS